MYSIVAVCTGSTRRSPTAGLALRLPGPDASAAPGRARDAGRS